jgi:hypothetical protein
MGITHIFTSAIKTYQKLLPVAESRSRSAKQSQRLMNAKKSVTTVGDLLAGLKPVPARSLLLGKCRDNLPFLIEFGDPQMGALLIGCEAGWGKTHQVQVMVDSAIRTHSPRKLQIAILTLNPWEWGGVFEDQADQKYLYGIHAWYDNRAESLIENLVELAEARRNGQRLGVEVLFILDDLPAVENLSHEAQVNLRWLLEYGSQSGVWLVATIVARQAGRLRFWVDTFRTRIIGRVPRQDDAETLILRKDSGAGDLQPGEFKLWTGNAWLIYVLPLLGQLASLEV